MSGKKQVFASTKKLIDEYEEAFCDKPGSPGPAKILVLDARAELERATNKQELKITTQFKFLRLPSVPIPLSEAIARALEGNKTPAADTIRTFFSWNGVEDKLING